MTPIRSELGWTYDPPDFLEADLSVTTAEADIAIGEGEVVATLKSPEEPVPDATREAVRTSVESVFRARQVLTHRSFNIIGPRERHHQPDGKINQIVRVGLAEMMLLSDRADVGVKASNGRVIEDSKAARIAEHSRLLSKVAIKIANSPTLQRMLASYSAAVDDPANELIHLYEIRDAAKKHYGSKQAALSSLPFPQKRWERLGQLANGEPLMQGRHRGAALTGLRSASREELAEARGIALDLIRAFIDKAI